MYIIITYYPLTGDVHSKLLACLLLLSNRDPYSLKANLIQGITIIWIKKLFIVPTFKLSVSFPVSVFPYRNCSSPVNSSSCAKSESIIFSGEKHTTHFLFTFSQHFYLPCALSQEMPLVSYNERSITLAKYSPFGLYFSSFFSILTGKKSAQKLCTRTEEIFTTFGP